MYWAVIIFLLLSINRGFANNLTAELATGGLVLLKTGRY